LAVVSTDHSSSSCREANRLGREVNRVVWAVDGGISGRLLMGGVIGRKGEITWGTVVLGSESIAISEAGSDTMAWFAAAFVGGLLLHPSLLRVSTSSIVHVLRIADRWVFVKAKPLLFGRRRHSGWSAVYGPWQCVHLGGH
jgi:hypothetical protein